LGEIVRVKSVTPNEIMRERRSVVLCAAWAVLEEELKRSGYMPISLNLPLARKLVERDEKGRADFVTEDALSLLGNADKVFLQDFEILFDPRYRLDVIRTFGTIARSRKLVVKWCGNFDWDTLVYGAPEYPDYKRYPIVNYDVTCVI
jgi:hypothetical protein